MQVPNTHRWTVVYLYLGFTGLISMLGIWLCSTKLHSAVAKLPTLNSSSLTFTNCLSTQSIESVAEKNRLLFEDAWKGLDNAGSLAEIDHVLAVVLYLPELQRDSLQREIEELESRATFRREEILYSSVKNASSLGDREVLRCSQDYLTAFPEGKYGSEVMETIKAIRERQQLQARRSIKGMLVDSPMGLARKRDQIEKFLEEFGANLESEELERMTLAVHCATELLTPGQYHCKLIRTTGLDQPRDHRLEVVVNGKCVATFSGSGDVHEKNWNESVAIQWSAGDTIFVKLITEDGIDYFFEQDMAYFEDSTAVGILLLTGCWEPSRFAVRDKWFGTDFTKVRPKIRMVWKCDELGSEKLAAIQGFLSPGSQW